MSSVWSTQENSLHLVSRLICVVGEDSFIRRPSYLLEGLILNGTSTSVQYFDRGASRDP